jgi:hypothetical protein
MAAVTRSDREQPGEEMPPPKPMDLRLIQLIVDDR